MVKRLILSVAMIVMTMGVGSTALAWWPGVEVDWHWYPPPGEEEEDLAIMNLPNGLGLTVEEARNRFGTAAEAAIYVTLTDTIGDPIYDYPYEDILVSFGPDPNPPPIEACLGGTVADHNTDINGVTTISGPFLAGGWSTSHSYVQVGGITEWDQPIPLIHNSPDINGDLIVNLSDVTIFAGDYFGDYSFRSDFFYDGVLNLSDVAQLANGVGAACP